MPTYSAGEWKPRRGTVYPTFVVTYGYDSYTTSGKNVTFNNVWVKVAQKSGCLFAGTNESSTIKVTIFGNTVVSATHRADNTSSPTYKTASWSTTYSNQSCSITVSGTAANSGGGTISHTTTITLPPPFTNPTWTNNTISCSDTTPATGTAAGSGNTVYWTCNPTWNSSTSSDNGVGPYRENPQEGIPGYTTGCPTNINSNARVTGYKVGQNQITLYLRYRDADNNMKVNAIATQAITVHEYINPSFTATQSPPTQIVAGTTSISVPRTISNYTNGDAVWRSTDYMYHFTRNRIRDGVSNTSNMELVSITKGNHSATQTFTTGISTLKPNDSFYVIIERSYEKSDTTTGHFTGATSQVNVIHRECGKPTSVTYSPTNMVEGYTYTTRVQWNNPSDWGTRSGTRYVNLNYNTAQNGGTYTVESNESNGQYHNVVTWSPAVTGTDRASTYYCDLFCYVGNTTYKSDSVRVNFPVKARVVPTASGLNLSSAAVTTLTSPSFTMAETVNWGNSQVTSSRQVKYELYVDNVLDSTVYRAATDSKTFSASRTYAWGTHSAYVKAVYSTDLGNSTTYTSNTVSFEIGAKPNEPSVSVNPLSVVAGQERTFTWTFSPGEWCLSSGRGYDYIIELDGTQIASGTKNATDTTISHTRMYTKAQTIKLKIRQKNSLGTSAYVESSGVISAPVAPTKATLTFRDIPIGLPNQNSIVDIVINSHGSYKHSSSNIKVEIINQSGTVVATPVAQTAIGMNATSYTIPTQNLEGYISGEFSYKVTYNKVYTSGLVSTSTVTQTIVPPDVIIVDKSSVEGTTLHINYQIDNTYSDNPYYLEYSQDYGKTWTRIQNKKSADVKFDYLDEIWIRAYGENPADSMLSDISKYEMVSRYKTWNSHNGGTVKVNRRIFANVAGTSTVRKVKRIIVVK